MVTYLFIYQQDTALVGKRMIIYACGYISSSYHYIYVYGIMVFSSPFFSFTYPHPKHNPVCLDRLQPGLYAILLL